MRNNIYQNPSRTLKLCVIDLGDIWEILHVVMFEVHIQSNCSDLIGLLELVGEKC
jgi:hypothetical protein